MVSLTIHDLDDRGVLAFDLRDLLRVIGPRAITAEWTITDPVESGFEATGPGGERLEALAEASAQIAGAELIAIAEDTQQVIWGDFAGKLPNVQNQDWVTIRAFDSSFFEVETSDEAVIEKLKSHFRDVRIEALRN